MDADLAVRICEPSWLTRSVSHSIPTSYDTIDMCCVMNILMVVERHIGREQINDGNNEFLSGIRTDRFTSLSILFRQISLIII